MDEKEQKMSTVYIESDEKFKELICTDFDVMNLINHIDKEDICMLKIETKELSSLIRILVKSDIKVIVGDKIEKYPIIYEKDLTANNKREIDGYILNISQEIEKELKKMPYILKVKVYLKNSKLVVESTAIIKGLLDLDKFLLKKD